MRRLKQTLSEMRHNVVTYDVGGQRVCLCVDSVRRFGAKSLLKDFDFSVEDENMIPVFQREKAIGAVPADFDPMFVRSVSFWYSPREGDFRRSQRGWEACWSLRPGDLGSIPGYVSWGVPCDPSPEPEPGT